MKSSLWASIELYSGHNEKKKKLSERHDEIKKCRERVLINDNSLWAKKKQAKKGMKKQIIWMWFIMGIFIILLF